MRWNQSIADESVHVEPGKTNKTRDVVIGLLFVAALLTSTLDFNSLLP